MILKNIVAQKAIIHGSLYMHMEYCNKPIFI